MNIFDYLDGDVEKISVRKLQEIQKTVSSRIRELERTVEEQRKIIDEDCVKINITGFSYICEKSSIEEVKKKFEEEMSRLKDIIHEQDREISLYKLDRSQLRNHIHNLLVKYRRWVPLSKLHHIQKKLYEELRTTDS